jgi:hypothetical protein
MLRSHGSSSQEPLSSLDENLEEIEKVWKECFPHKEFKAGAEKTQEEAKSLDEARVRCRECLQEMKTEDRQVHVYRHHLREPKLYECPACDFSHYACSSDVRSHILRAHKNQPDLMPRANLLRYSREIAEWNERCFPGWFGPSPFHPFAIPPTFQDQSPFAGQCHRGLQQLPALRHGRSADLSVCLDWRWQLWAMPSPPPEGTSPSSTCTFPCTSALSASMVGLLA